MGGVTIMHAFSSEANLRAGAELVAARVFRTGADRPGFALLGLEEKTLTGRDFRQLLVRLGEDLGEWFGRTFGRGLGYFSLGRFDQQVSTEAHRDGGPDETFLILGYEPTTVRSRLRIFDHVRAARDHGLTPDAFLARYNPLFPQGREALASYGSEVEGFDPTSFQILVINNSVGPELPGVLHQATIPEPDPSARRVVHSLIMTPRPGKCVSWADVQAFVESGQTATIVV
jgi:hypothetical protein